MRTSLKTSLENSRKPLCILQDTNRSVLGEGPTSLKNMALQKEETKKKLLTILFKVYEKIDEGRQ